MPLVDVPLGEDPTWRIIAVPGNHDVDWTADIWEQQSLCTLTRNDAEGLRRLLAEARRKPLETEHRLAETHYGHLEVFRRRPDHYADRFCNVQEFFDGLYGSSTTPEFSPFALTASPPRHWSAHLFPRLGFAFYGFNSCARNDNLWTGASIDPAAIHEASTHARTNASNLVRIAVWHHGLTAEHGHVDAITPTDLTRLVNEGFRLGLHGHIHKDQEEALDTIYQGRFVRLAVGTLNADHDERPELRGRQFAVVHLYPGQVQVQVYEQGQQTMHPFEKKPRKIHSFSTDEVARSPSTARLHQRRWRLDEAGIAHVSVHLEDVDVQDGAALALVTPPFNRVVHEATASSERATLDVRRVDLPDGRVRCVLGQRERHERLDWNYTVSAAFAIFQGDDVRVAALESPSTQHRQLTRWRPVARDDEEVFCHTVRILTEHLELHVELPPTATMDSARAIVERAHNEHGVEIWRTEPSEERRCLVAHLDEHRARLTVDAPSLGFRYALAIKLATPAPQRSDRSLRVVEDVLAFARNSRPNSSPAHPVQQRVREAFYAFLHDPTRQTFAAETAWHVLLWNKQRGKIFTALGEFPSNGWNVRFEPGFGVAGHAFRFHRPACWHRNTVGAQSLIFQERTELQSPYNHEYAWVVCVPILDEQGGAVGTFSIASPASESPGDRYLSRLAESFVHREDPAITALDRLSSGISIAFWSACATLEALDPDDRNHARNICDALVARASLPAPSPSPP